MESCVPKVAELRERFPTVNIEVDGGVSPKNVHLCADAGSNVIVAGTSIFGSEHPDEVITELKAAVSAGQAKLAERACHIHGVDAQPQPNGRH